MQMIYKREKRDMKLEKSYIIWRLLSVTWEIEKICGKLAIFWWQRWFLFFSQFIKIVLSVFFLKAKCFCFNFLFLPPESSMKKLEKIDEKIFCRLFRDCAMVFIATKFCQRNWNFRSLQHQTTELSFRIQIRNQKREEKSP